MTEDGGYEPIEDVADWSVELRHDAPEVDAPDGETGLIREKMAVPRASRLFLCALDRDDKTFRNYMKSQKRSMRNSRARH